MNSIDFGIREKAWKLSQAIYLMNICRHLMHPDPEFGRIYTVYTLSTYSHTNNTYTYNWIGHVLDVNQPDYLLTNARIFVFIYSQTNGEKANRTEPNRDIHVLMACDTSEYFRAIVPINGRIELYTVRMNVLIYNEFDSFNGPYEFEHRFSTLKSISIYCWLVLLVFFSRPLPSLSPIDTDWWPSI